MKSDLQIEPHIKAYFDLNIGIATEEFQHRLTVMTETWEARTRNLIREEFQDLIKPYLESSRIWEAEMRSLRLDVNKHDKRINKLEHRHA